MRPSGMLNPINILTAFYFLYVTVPVTVETWMSSVGYSLELDWVQIKPWNLISEETLELTVFTFYLQAIFLFIFTETTHRNCINPPDTITIRYALITTLCAFSLLLVWLFMSNTAGIELWLSDYSNTYLSKRLGYGGLNYALITLGNATVFALGIAVMKRKYILLSLLLGLLTIGSQAFVGGIKGRLFILLLLFLSPWIVTVRPKIVSLGVVVLSFFSLLYLTTLWRTAGFYSSGSRFLEMMIGYFNAVPLHDSTIASTDPEFFSTLGLLLVKPQQVLGLLPADVSFDISVELTKRYFPSNWEELATQQWPLLTELHLNYYGIWFSWIPLFIYCGVLAYLYNKVVRDGNYAFLPIYTLEFIRLFAVQRGTIIPWDTPVIIAQYLVIYFLTKSVLNFSTNAIADPRGGRLAK